MTGPGLFAPHTGRHCKPRGRLNWRHVLLAGIHQPTASIAEARTEAYIQRIAAPAITPATQARIRVEAMTAAIRQLPASATGVLGRDLFGTGHSDAFGVTP